MYFNNHNLNNHLNIINFNYNFINFNNNFNCNNLYTLLHQWNLSEHV